MPKRANYATSIGQTECPWTNYFEFDTHALVSEPDKVRDRINWSDAARNEAWPVAQGDVEHRISDKADTWTR